MSVTNDPKKTELASNFNVAQYEAACKAKDRNAISDALRRRFTERYIDPVTPAICRKSHGFTIMAISCLMIESLQSFCEGWENSNGRSEIAFCHFFDSQRQFNSLRGHFAEFYKNVRCGILHQAETTAGWKINKKSGALLFDPTTNTINAMQFLKCIGEVLETICDQLKSVDWDSELWKNVRKKMNALCVNCKS